MTGGEGAFVHGETAVAVEATDPVIAETLAEAADGVHVSYAGAPAPLDLGKHHGNAVQVYWAGDTLRAGRTRRSSG